MVIKKFLLLISIFVLGININLYSQSQLEFISQKNNKKLIFKVGDKVGYSKKGLSFLKSGKIESIKKTYIMVSGKVVFIDDIKLIGHRRRGTTTINILSIFVAFSTFSVMTLPNDNSKTLKVIGLFVSIPTLFFGQINEWKNRTYNVSEKYNYEVKP
jgi:hypothetical protein